MASADVAWRWFEIGIVSWSLLSFSVYVAAIAWCSFANFSAIRESFDLLPLWFRAACCTKQEGDDGPVAAAALRLIQERKNAICRCGLYAVSPLLAIGVLVSICRGVGLPHFEDNASLGESHAIVIAIAPALAALCVFRKEEPTTCVMIVAQVVGFGALIWTCVQFKTGLALLFDRPTSLAIRLAFALMLCDTRLTLSLNVLYSVVAIFKFLSFVSTDEDIAQLPFHPFVYQELGAVVVLTAVGGALSWRMDTEARTAIEAKASMSFISGLSTLLKTSYDVVVELKDDFTLATESNDLAGLLLHGPHRSLKGLCFTDLMAFDADRDVFSAHAMKSSHASQSESCAIPHRFRMRDSNSSLLSLEMWHSRLEDMYSRTRHLVGIKERRACEEMSPCRSPSLRSVVVDIPVIDRSIPTRQENHEVHPAGEGFPAQGRVAGGRNRAKPTGAAEGESEAQPGQGHMKQGLTHGQVAQAAEQHLAPHAPSLSHVIGRSSADEDCDGSSSTSSVPWQSFSSTTRPGTSTRSDRPSKCLIDGFKLTTPQAKRTSLLMALSNWNVAVRSAGCCTYHDVIAEAKNTVKNLKRAACNPFNSQGKTWQCSGCGILDSSPLYAQYDPVSRTCGLCRDVESGVLGRVQL